MEKRKGRSLNSIYSKPLPLTLSVDKFGQLPEVTVHNPISWLHLLYRVASIYFRTPPQFLEPKLGVQVVSVGANVHFEVSKPLDMEKLWQQGFFGKGTLSRSDPTWEQRTERRLNINGAADRYFSKEDVTNLRREDRKAFKALRAKAQDFESMGRKRELTSDENAEWEKVKKEIENLKATNSLNVPSPRCHKANVRSEDEDLIDPETRSLKANIEKLQLQKIELFFLYFALDVVEVTSNHEILSLKDVFDLCMGKRLVPENRFMLDYAVYHHFRSLGWCVRSGIKFGCDMLLYKRGPPFMHAEFAILVIPNNGEKWTTWEDFMAVARVVSGVKKTLVLVYVDMPVKSEFDRAMQIPNATERFGALFRNYRITEVIYKRWSPSRTRE